MDPREGDGIDLLDPVRWLSAESDGHDREREFLASLRQVTPTLQARRAVWEAIESSAGNRTYVDHRPRYRPVSSAWLSRFAAHH
jgi:hypothetical protein